MRDPEREIDSRLKQHSLEKQFIGVYTAFYLRKNSRHRPVAIDGGSTNLCVLEAIYRDTKARRSTVSQVLTNHLEGIYLARDLPDDMPPFWRCLGGVLRMSRAVFVEGAEEALRACNFWMAVVGTDGFDPPWLLTGTNREHLVKNTMIRRATHSVIFPIDSSKWGHPAGSYLFTLDEVASLEKRVVLITCYPIQEENEPDDEFVIRKDLFFDKIKVLTQHWPYNLATFTALVNTQDVDFIENKLSGEVALETELQTLYANTIPAEQAAQTGLIIRFDLWVNA